MKTLNHSFENCKPFLRIATQTWPKMNTFYAICCRPGVAGDVISNENIKITEDYAYLNFKTASISSLRENQSAICVTRFA